MTRSTLLALGLLTLVACTVDEREPVRSAPAPAFDPSPAACGECHSNVLAEWETSLHAAAFSDPVFRAEYDPAPAESCRNCHNPPTRAPGAEGIDCATCHVRAGKILASDSSPEGLAAHPIEVDASLRDVDPCDQCHQFRFTNDGVHDPEEALQNTVEEWRRSEAAERGQSCIDCHMPREPDGDRRSHAFPGMADPRLLSGAIKLQFEPRRTDTGIDIDVRLRGGHIGHSFPTGDLFRRAVLTVRSESGVEARLIMQRWLARTADPDGEDSHVRTVDDNRVPPPGSGVLSETLQLADPDARELEWRLELHRLPLAQARERGLTDVMTIVPVRSGTLRVPE